MAILTNKVVDVHLQCDECNKSETINLDLLDKSEWRIINEKLTESYLYLEKVDEFSYKRGKVQGGLSIVTNIGKELKCFCCNECLITGLMKEIPKFIKNKKESKRTRIPI